MKVWEAAAELAESGFDIGGGDIHDPDNGNLFSVRVRLYIERFNGCTRERALELLRGKAVGDVSELPES